MSPPLGLDINIRLPSDMLAPVMQAVDAAYWQGLQAGVFWAAVAFFFLYVLTRNR